MRLTNLDLDALRSFVVGMEAGSFARAAERLGRSTSAISAQLRKLEDQAGTPLLRRSGRGLVLTDGGEALMSYARRLLALNDEAVGAVRGLELEGWVRLGLQEDFGESILPQVLGRFARAHPKVRIEGRVARNQELKEKLASGQLDLALAWDDGAGPVAVEPVASLPLRWFASAEAEGLRQPAGEGPLPLVMLQAPCLMRTLACEQLDRHGVSWRLAFVSQSLGGMWAATSAGLGVSVRTGFGAPASVRALDPVAFGLPALPSLRLALLRTQQDIGPTGEHLATIIGEALREALPAEWLLA